MKNKDLLSLSATGFCRIAYTEWGAAGAPRTVVCVHGLTRNGRDFDALAAALAVEARVVCPDVAGRGASGWLADSSAYAYPQYLADMTALIARLDTDAVDWIGTSMGGLIGMFMAAQPNTPIRRLIVNDVGPFIPKTALQRIAEYVGAGRTFADVAEVEAYLREVHAPFGPLSDEQWRHLAAHSVRRGDDDRLALHYDPGIADAFRQGPVEEIDDVDLWPLWDRIACPVLVLRGAESDLLRAETAAEMAVRGPKAEVVEIAGCGHAPMLMDESQIAVIRDWLWATG
jgi:pimeloyl-ACP methyl ester carboxylesterase